MKMDSFTPTHRLDQSALSRKLRKRPRELLAAALFLVYAWAASVCAGVLYLPNASFELPRTDFADPRVDAWQKAMEPAWHLGGGGFPWSQLVGQFLNTTNGSPSHIDNMDGDQAAFLFALPEVAIFQDYNSISATETVPTHDFAVKFEPGNSYSLTVGVIGGGGGMTNGATLEITLYYRDEASNIVAVAARTITNTVALFPTNTHFIDFEASVPPVKASDPWAGKYVGIRLASTVGFDRQGGYWDLDNVRLQIAGPLVLVRSGVTGGKFQFTLQSAPGRYEILAGSRVTLPISGWSSLGIVTNSTGVVSFTDSNPVSGAMFYRARQAP